MTKPGRKKTGTDPNPPRMVLEFASLFTDADLQALLAAGSVEGAREVLRGGMADRVTAVGVEQLRMISSWRKTQADKKKAKKGAYTEEEQAFLEWVRERWVTLTKRTKDVNMTEVRARNVLARMREGRTREEFEAILRWCAGNDWMSGRDPKTNGRSFDDLTTLFGSAAKFDKYLEQSRRKRVFNSSDLRAGGPDRPSRLL